jgi:HlyD family secretion protein
VVNQNVVSYDVVLGVPNPELRLMPGMTANLTIAVVRKEDVLQVPAAALRFVPPDALEKKAKGAWKKRSAGRIWILEGGKPRSLEVRVGLSDGSHTEIEGPLAPGAEVIIGMDSAKPSGTAAQSTPFGMPRMGGGSRGGGGRAH